MEAQEIRTSQGQCGYSLGGKSIIDTHQSINGCKVYIEADTENEARRQAMNLKSFFGKHLQ